MALQLTKTKILKRLSICNIFIFLIFCIYNLAKTATRQPNNSVLLSECRNAGMSNYGDARR